MSGTTFRITTRNGADFSTDEMDVLLAGSGPARLRQVLVNGESYGLTHTTMTGWSINEIPLGPGPNVLELLAFDLNGDLISADSITVTSTAAVEPPELTAIEPAEALAGDTIEIRGSGFLPGLTVLFGETPSPRVNRASDTLLTAEVPPGEGLVEVKVSNSNGQESATVSFSYLDPAPTFMRGDANGDGFLDISDGIAVINYLFIGRELDCLDAADVDDDEELLITDGVYLLDFLFRTGSAPPAPYPDPGPDPEGEALGCGI